VFDTEGRQASARLIRSKDSKPVVWTRSFRLFQHAKDQGCRRNLLKTTFDDHVDLRMEGVEVSTTTFRREDRKMT
jgi:hypothetical protein